MVRAPRRSTARWPAIFAEVMRRSLGEFFGCKSVKVETEANGCVAVARSCIVADAAEVALELNRRTILRIQEVSSVFQGIFEKIADQRERQAKRLERIGPVNVRELSVQSFDRYGAPPPTRAVFVGLADGDHDDLRIMIGPNALQPHCGNGLHRVPSACDHTLQREFVYLFTPT
jgi:hypothetical protein